MDKHLKIVLVAGFCAAFAVGGVLVTFTAQGASNLSDAASLSQNNNFTGLQNKFPKGIFIGEQGSGGVTYFNGSIVNATTDEAGNDNPVTFGDNVRIDGMITRGADASSPVWIGSGLKIDGDVEGLGISDVDGLQDDLDGKADASHNHDGRYYTESESNARYYTQNQVGDNFVGKSSPSWDAQNGRVVIPGANFEPENTDTEETKVITAAAALELADKAEDTPSFYAGIQLPNGATVTGLTLNFYDNCADDTVSAQLRRGIVSTATDDAMTSLVYSDDQSGPGSNSTTDVNYATVDNDNYSYYIYAEFSDDDLGSDLRLVSVEVAYTFTEPY